MRKFFWVIVCVLSLLLCQTRAASRDGVLDSVKKATGYLKSISTHGGFVGIYSLDLKERFGEALYEKASHNEIWVQPPGTPSVGDVLLRLYRIQRDRSYLLQARDAGRALAWGQSAEGGWDHRVDVSALEADSIEPERKSGRGTFDDRITQGALEFLMDLDRELDEAWLNDAIQLGLDFMLRSQFENGAWPQWFPLRGGYHDYYTYNDSAINDCIDLLLGAYRQYGDSRYLAGAKLGGRFIIESQLPAPQSGWAQQYDHDLQPAWARRFEPPGVCSAASVHNLRTLSELFVGTNDLQFLKPFPSALAWLEASVLPEAAISRLKFTDPKDRQRRIWARLYEVGSNRPIYGDREVGNQVFYDLDKISARERNSYGWQGTFGVDSVMKLWREIEAQGAASWRTDQLAARQLPRVTRVNEERVDAVMARQDAQGRWITEDRIRIGEFVTNLNLMADYLEAHR